MPRISGYRGTWNPNKRPYLTVAADAYISLQGETSLIACGECRREVNLNRYLTGISVDTSVESPPGSATVNLSVPDNDINEFYVDNELVIIPMMEVELYAKGYFTVGGFPQYYRIFWGVVTSVGKNWNNGVTTITLQCKDILRWWEITNVITQSAFLEASKSQSGWHMFQNKFAGANPYTVIIELAKESMGDFSLTTGSFTSFRPEYGPEQRVVAQYAKDIMAYWQLKFGNIWNNLVLYGTSGQAYTFAGDPGNVISHKVAKDLFNAEEPELNLNPETNLFKNQPHEIAAVKVDISRAADISLFQNESQSKLSMALTARDQAGAYEFYCDTTGDIIFKPPFYNLNVLPNKPVSWIQDFEIIDDNITDSEQEVFTHITSSGNAFGGVTDWGLNDDITTPRTGVVDWHLLKRYGWRRMDVQLEWPGNPKKLFYYLLDYLDRVNAKRQYGSVTIPLRPELRMGFPIWFPKYDSFFYINAISHNYSPGGQATTALTLIARRQKFIAPKNIGQIVSTGDTRTTEYVDPKTKKKFTVNQETYNVSFPSGGGATAGLTDSGQVEKFGGPAIMRNPKTGKLLGFPNAVMVYRSTLSGQKLTEVIKKSGSKKGHKPQKQGKDSPEGPLFNYSQVSGDLITFLHNEKRAEVIDRLRIHRYEAGMSNAGAYDYAHDVKGKFKEFSVIPVDSIQWNTDPNTGLESSDGEFSTGAQTYESKEQQQQVLNKAIEELNARRPDLQQEFNEANEAVLEAEREFQRFKQGKANPNDFGLNSEIDEETAKEQELLNQLKTKREVARVALADLDKEISDTRLNKGNIQVLKALNVMVRPVSDEFGFEVVGHNRYGRGAFIDRGQLQIPDPNSVGVNPNQANQLNIQFSPHGGLLTDPGAQTANNLGLDSTNFAELYERMQPEDYYTGASFKGANYSGGDSQLEEVNPTGQNTYNSSMANARSNGGTAIFAEADALRRAVTLAEMKPTLQAGGPNGLSSVGFEKCGCALGRTEWLTVLPSSFIRRVLSPVGSESINTDVTTVTVGGDSIFVPPDHSFDPSGAGLTALDSGVFDENDNLIENYSVGDDGSIVADNGTVIVGPNITTLPLSNNFSLTGGEGFFSVLREYLISIFSQDYMENMKREEFAKSGGIDVVSPNLQDDGNILGLPKSSLFDRAAQGDPDALEALQQGANFNFGQTKEGIDNFKGAVDEAVDKAEQQYKNQLASIPGSLFSSATGGLVTINEDGQFESTVTVDEAPPPQHQPPTNLIQLPTFLNPAVGPPVPVTQDFDDE